MDFVLGDIRLLAGEITEEEKDFWQPCDGRELRINEYQALFSIIGSLFGGNDATVFCLPDLRVTVPMGAVEEKREDGRVWLAVGKRGGSNEVALDTESMPSHQHRLLGLDTLATLAAPQAGTMLAQFTSDGVTSVPVYATTAQGTVALNEQSLAESGHGTPHENMQPTLGVYFYICVKGLYPPRRSTMDQEVAG